MNLESPEAQGVADSKAGGHRNRKTNGLTWRNVTAGTLRLDVRSLAVFRMLIACLLLADQWLAATNLRAFYLDTGVLPRQAMLEHTHHTNLYWSLYLAFDSPLLVGGLLAIAAMAAIALLLGYRTTLATVLCWIMLVSLHGRNALILSGGDSVMRMMLFWGMFLPLGACWSMDAQRRKAQGQLAIPPVPLLASVAVLLQITYVYSFGAALKSDPAWHEKGTAIHLALSLDSFESVLGAWFVKHPAASAALTHSVWWIEAFGPVLFFLPFWNGICRTVAFFVFCLMHIGIGLMMSLESFSTTMCVALITVLPAGFWEWVQKRRNIGAKLERFYRHERLQAAFRAVERVLPRPSESQPAAAAGPRLSLWQRSRPVVVNGFCALCLLYTLESNLGWLDARFWNRWMPAFLSEVGRTFRLVQGWRMFAPRPPVENGWPILVAKLENGLEVDLLRNGNGVDWGKPDRLTFEDYRWRRLLMNMWDARYGYARPYVASYFCRNWNAKQPKGLRVVSYQLWFMRERIALPGQPPRPVRKVLLLKNDRFSTSGSVAAPSSVRSTPRPTQSTTSSRRVPTTPRPKVRPLQVPSFIPPTSPKPKGTPLPKPATTVRPSTPSPVEPEGGN